MRRGTLSGLIVAGVLAAFLGGVAPARAGTLTVTANTSNCGVLTPVTNNGGLYTTPPDGGCYPNLIVSDNGGIFPQGTYGQLVAYAPAGISITSATVDSSDASEGCCGSAWWAGSFWAGGADEWGPAFGLTETDQFPAGSPYWGFQLWCAASSVCSDGDVSAQSVTLTAVENQAPGLTADGANNLWYQGSHYIWNPPGDPWSLALSGTDVSGVCDLGAFVNNVQLTGPVAPQNTFAWQQCPSPNVWTPAQGAQVDTRSFIPGTGSMPLTVWGINAAGVEGSVSETLRVDNQPVGVNLTTPNDANPTAWVNHAVAVNAAATAGPSGVGATRCGIDGASTTPYPTSGLMVNGNGVQTVTCTAWNQAVGPQGQANSGSSSMSIQIDEAPPSVSFQPPNPSDPTNVVVDTTDNESGVATGSVEIAPAGSGEWTSLPTSFDGGAHLLSGFDDAGIHGPYTIRATSCDNVGNCASTSETLTMPLRLEAASDVGFATISSPAKVVTMRVWVGAPSKQHARHPNLAHGKRRGHYVRVRVVIRANRRCAHKLVKIGRRRWREVTACRPLKVHVVNTKTVAYGEPFMVHGLLMTTQGVPLANAPVSILTAPNNDLNQFSQAATATTNNAGEWSATLPPGPSRIIRAVYGGSGTALPAAGSASVRVRARITLRVSSRHLGWNGVLVLRGHLDGGYVPPDGVALRLLIRLSPGARPYQPVPFRTDFRGNFSIRWTWGRGVGVATYPFAIATTANETDYPFAASRSAWIPVTFGGRAPT
jgi:hypothetical protein